MYGRILGFVFLTFAITLAACESSTVAPTAPGDRGLSPATHEAGVVVVHPGDMQGWGFASEGGDGTGQMVDGPAAPPLGTGSANFILDSGDDGHILGYAHYGGTRLDEIDALTYSTYRTSGSAALAVALQFNIDVDLTDGNNAWQGRLVYEPYYNHAVLTGVWQTWNTRDDAPGGNWWFTGAPQNTVCSIGDPCTWSEVLSEFPDAGVHGDFGAVILKAGSGWSSFDGNVDALTIGVSGTTTTYDYELEAPSPQTKDDCKNGGWEQFGFKNQGQCIKFVNTGKDSR